MKLYNKGEMASYFKRRQHKNTKANKRNNLIIFVMVVILGYFIFNIYNNTKTDFSHKEMIAQAKQIKEKQEKLVVLREKANLTKALLEDNVVNAERFVTEVNNEIEYITLTETGTKSITNSRTTKDAGWWTKTFKESKVEVNFDYKAIFSISTKDIKISTNNGVVHIDYDPNVIAVKSIEASNLSTDSKKDLFGKKYSNQEVLSIEELAKEDIYKELNKDPELKDKSCKNLNNYFTDLAKKMKVNNLIINSKELIKKPYTFVDNGTIKYNQPNKPLNNVDYIVIHSTGCKNITAMQFYNNLNSRVQKREASAHFFIDDQNVVQAIATNLQSWSVGCKEPKIPCTNENSISVEITEFTDPEKQQLAIDNAVSFVKNVLVKQFPDAQIVAHRMISRTLCPSVLTDEQFKEYFN